MYMFNRNNSFMRCDAPRCGNRRYSIGKYCLKCKNSLSETGSIHQQPLKRMKTTLVPYIRKFLIEINENEEKYKEYINKVNRLLDKPYLINSMYISPYLNELLVKKDTTLPRHIIKSFEVYTIDGKKLLAAIISLFVYQKERPLILNDGDPLFFYCGKLIFGYCKSLQTRDDGLILFKRKTKLTRAQNMIIGLKFYSTFQDLINEFLEQTKDGDPNRRKSKQEQLDDLEEERDERIRYMKNQYKKNEDFTKEMLDKEIKAIRDHFNNEIKELKNS